MDWEKQALVQRLHELEDENENLKCENAELTTKLNRISRQLSVIQEQLDVSEQVTIATQRRELQEEGIFEIVIEENAYEKLRSDLMEVHVYTPLLAGSFLARHAYACYIIL